MAIDYLVRGVSNLTGDIYNLFSCVRCRLVGRFRSSRLALVFFFLSLMRPCIGRSLTLGVWTLCIFALVQFGFVGVADTFSVERGGQRFPIVGVLGFDPVVRHEGELRLVKGASIVADKASKSQKFEVSAELSSLEVFVNSMPKNSVRVATQVKPSRDVGDVFVVVSQDGQDQRGRNKVVVAELPELAAEEFTEVDFAIPVSAGWKIGETTIHLYSGESKIQLLGSKSKKPKGVRFTAKKGTARADMVIGNRMPRVLFQVDPDGIPKQLVAEAEQAFVVLEYFIETDGRVKEVTAVDYSHEELVKPVSQAIRKSVFSPAFENGEPSRYPAKQTIWIKRPAKEE